MKRLIIVLIFLTLIFVSCTNDISNTEYYKQSAERCQKGDRCCLSSVEVIVENNYSLAPGSTLSNSGCPENTQENMLKCPTSLRWCQPK